VRKKEGDSGPLVAHENSSFESTAEKSKAEPEPMTVQPVAGIKVTPSARMDGGAALPVAPSAGSSASGQRNPLPLRIMLRTATFLGPKRLLLAFVLVTVILLLYLPGWQALLSRFREGSFSMKEMTVDRWLQKMTLEEKVGQLFMLGFQGRTISYELSRAIEGGRVGGVIIFERNVTDAAQLAELNAQLQAKARARGPGLFIAVDQEGGPIARLRRGFTVFPSSMAIGATTSPELAYQAARQVALELAAVGINMNLAPVLDVNNNPANPVIGIRSFGEDPHLVGELGVAQLRGYRDGGIIAVGKHFPGHGDTAVDSHLGLPVVAYPRSRLEQVELIPFKMAIGDSIDAIMTAHIVFPAIDQTPGLPATLSPGVLQKFLRQELGFDGLIITDALDVMKAITDHFGKDKAIVKAVQAGADILLLAESFGEQEALYNILLDAVRRGEISEARINESVRRILKVKAKYGLLPGVAGSPTGGAQSRLPVSDDPAAGKATTGIDPTTGSVSTPAARDLAARIARQAVTLVRNEGGLLPLKNLSGKRIVVFTPAIAGTYYNEPATSLRSWIGETISRRHTLTWELQYSRRPTAAQVDKALEMAASADLVIFGSHNLNLEPEAIKFAQRIAATGKPMVLVALGNPYDLMVLPQIRMYLVTYGSEREVGEALAGVLFGEFHPSGHLPVTIPGLYPRGWGITECVLSCACSPKRLSPQ